jgi:hypothetical protein
MTSTIHQVVLVGVFGPEIGPAAGAQRVARASGRIVLDRRGARRSHARDVEPTRAASARGSNASTAIGARGRRGPHNFAEPRATIAGTHRALDADMPSIDTIESINREQLATASDRLLLRGRVSRQRPRTRWVAPRGSWPEIPHGPLAEGSQPRIVLPARRTQHPAPPVRVPQLFVSVPTARNAPARRGAMPRASALAPAMWPLEGFAAELAAL